MIYLPISPNSVFRNSKFLAPLIYTFSTGIELFLYLRSCTYFKQVEGIWPVYLACLGTHCMDASNYWGPGRSLLDSRLPWTTTNHLRRRRQWCFLLRTRPGTAAPCWKIPTRMLILWQNSGAPAGALLLISAYCEIKSWWILSLTGGSAM